MDTERSEIFSSPIRQCVLKFYSALVNQNKEKGKKRKKAVYKHIILSNDNGSLSVEELKLGIWGGERALQHLDLIESLIYCSLNCSARI